MLAFIQSEHFARVLKHAVAKYVPKEGLGGVDADFSEVSVTFFPPGLSLKNARVSVGPNNSFGLPAGSRLHADRIDLVFRFFQALSGTIRVNEVVVVGGDLRLVADRAWLEKAEKPKKPTQPSEFRWEDLLSVRTEALMLRDTRFRIELATTGSNAARAEPEFAAEGTADRLRVAQWGTLGLETEIALHDFRVSPELLGLKREARKLAQLDSLELRAHANALGARLDRFFLKAPGLELAATGALSGDLASKANPKGLQVSSDFEGSADLEPLLAMFLPNAPASASLTAPATPGSLASGRVSFKGSGHGDLQKAAETLKLEATVDGENMRFKKWHAEHLHAEGGWRATGAGNGELSVARAAIWSPEVSRQPPRPGDGGRIELGAFRVATDGRQPFTVPITLERAHIHWLGAVSMKDVFPLDFRASGPIKLSFTPASEGKNARGWSALAELQPLTVTDFVLDNQRLGVTKPLHRVLQVPKITLTGGVRFDAASLRPEGLMVDLPHTHFKPGGKIDFKTGWDLTATGPVNLADLGTLAENEIRGEGQLDLHVHGPTVNTTLDFDAQLSNTYYLSLALGDLKGRISWLDGPDRLVFTDIKLKKNQTEYHGEGEIDLPSKPENGDHDKVALNFQIARGDIQDLIQVFQSLTKDLWWFPRSLAGPFSGSVAVTGGVDTRELKVQAQVKGAGWEFLGERFQAVAFHGGYDRGKYALDDLKAVKRAGAILGKVSYDAEHRFEWDLHTREFTVSDLDHVAQLDVPIRGKLQIDSSGKGTLGPEMNLASSTEVGLTSLAVRGTAMPPSQLTIKTEGDVARAHGSALGGSGTLEASYDFAPGRPCFIRGELKQLDYSPILLLLNSTSIQDSALAGYVTGSGNLSFRSGELEKASGKVELDEYVLSRTGTSFRLAKPVIVTVSDGSFDLPAAVLRGNQGEARLSLRSRRAALEGSIAGDVDVSIAQFFTSSITDATGTASLDFAIGGTLKAPTLFGRATLGGAAFTVGSLESPFENVTGSLQLRQNVLTVQNLEADLAGGRATVDGQIQLFTSRWPSIALRGSVAGSKLKVYPFQFVHIKSSSLSVTGDAPPYLIDGNVYVDSALSKEKVFAAHGPEGMKAVQYMPPATSPSQSGYSTFKLNIDARADKGIMVQNEIFEGELKGHLQLINTLDTPRILGTAEVLQGSSLTFKDRKFQIQSATANFDNPTVINPAFNLIATTEVNKTKIQLYASGRLGGSNTEPWKISLTSNPVMPESELLSLLALGLTSNDSKRLTSADRSAVEQGEGVSMLLHSLDFNREVQNKTGVEIQVDETQNSQVGTSIFRPQAQAESTVAPRIVIKKRLGDRVELSAGSTVGVGTSSQKGVNAELKVTPGFSVIGAWDYYETVDTQLNTKSYGSYGLDLKVQKRFK